MESLEKCEAAGRKNPDPWHYLALDHSGRASRTCRRTHRALRQCGRTRKRDCRLGLRLRHLCRLQGRSFVDRVAEFQGAIRRRATGVEGTLELAELSERNGE